MTQTEGSLAQSGHYVSANGLNMYYEECGSGEPLILLHGGSGTCKMWQPHLSCFVPHFRVITPDSRAHGKTDNPTGELSYRLMADDVAAFIQALGLIKPLVFGYSDGGQIALEIGMRYPTLARVLVVGAAWYKFSETYLAFLKAAAMESAGAVNIEYIQREMPDWADMLKTEHVRADDPDYWQTMLKQLSVMWWTPLDYTAEDLQKITDPTLILLGDRDGAIELQQAIDLYQLIPNSELAILPNVTHLSAIYSDRSKLAMDIVLDFLLRHSAQAEPQ
jgi:pimeloyl-ACP methyl ester carboxylesterase